MVDISELERLAELVQNANIRDLTLKQGGARLTIRKRVASSQYDYDASGAEASRTEYGGTESGIAYDIENVDVETSFLVPEAVEAEWITAPLVGVFRHSKMAVGLGSPVTPGQVVGVIEAMKLINEVTADQSGVITEVLVEDGMAVEYGQPLFAFKPEG